MHTSIDRWSWAEVCARRLERHGLTAPSPDARAADIVRAICGAHAQIMSAAEVSVALRLRGSTRRDVQHALWTEHSLVKTYGPRGTVHLLTMEDLPLWSAALSALPPSHHGHSADVRLNPVQTDTVVAAIASALEEAELTVDELGEAVVAGAGQWAGARVMPAFNGMWPRWRMAIGTAANRGVLCFGPNRGRNVTYTNPRRWLPTFQAMDGQAALAELLKRYLYAYGPATSQHVAQWLAIPQGWASALFDRVSGELQQVEIEGLPAWIVAGDTAMPSTPPAGVRLLPYFDAYVVGCHPRALVFPGSAAERALAGGQAGNFPVLLIGGTVAGVWHLRRAGRRLEITIEALDELSSGQRAELDGQAQRLGEILEGTPRLSFGAVTTGPHA